MKHWDIFISHAREDKKRVVEPLARNLEGLGVRVWYDTLSLSTGDLLSSSIDRGLEDSVFGLLIISPDFLAKKWPRYEGEYLLKREKEADSMVLTLWHNVEYEEVRAWSPELADRVPIRTSSRSSMEIATEVLKLVRPDILTNVHKRIAWLTLSRNTKSKLVPVTSLRLAPFQHSELPDELLGRIRLIRASLLNVYPHSFDFWVEGFRRDSHPSENVSRWEHICSVYQEYVSTIPLTPEQQRAAFNAILGISIDGSPTPADQPEIAQQLPEGAVEFLSKMFSVVQPLFDWKGEIFNYPWAEPSEDDQEMKAFFATKDREYFPKDLPDDLMEELIKKNNRASRLSRKRGSKSSVPTNVSGSNKRRANRKQISWSSAGGKGKDEKSSYVKNEKVGKRSDDLNKKST